MILDAEERGIMNKDTVIVEPVAIPVLPWLSFAPLGVNGFN
jgi:chloramphenicol O-acetyltransferase